MKNVGIVCEYNPFHNGHAKQIAAVHQDGGTAICLMSGNFVQRGAPALFDKWVRAEAAVRCGADLVLELPLTYALRSAEGFAAGGVELFDRFGCVQELCFGSENGTEENIMSTAKMLCGEKFPAVLKEELAKGLSFPLARACALERLGGNAGLLTQPNDILAVEYCKAIVQRGSALKPKVLRREGAYYADHADPENPSASYLRGAEDWQGMVPPEALQVFAPGKRYTLAAGERAVLARLRGMSEEEFESLPYGSEGLWRKVMHGVRSAASVEEILLSAKSKRYTRTRLSRMLMCAYLGITETMLQAAAPFVRVLSMNENGQKVLRKMRDCGGIPVLNGGELPEDKEFAELERRAADLYDLFAEDTVTAAGGELRGRSFRMSNDG